jgi:histone-lysine N-methyltransferase SETD2
MTNDVKERVRTLSVAGVAPAQILTLIRSKPSCEHVIARDVYNLKRQHRIEQHNGRTPMEALLSSLIKLDVPNTHCVDASGRLTRLAFTSTKAVQLTRRFGTVLTMDCTYKMNRFKMPLLHIVSFACTGATFTLAIAFLNAETIEDYEWALNTYKGFMGNYPPLAIVTDRELALMRATEIAFLVAHKMFC